MVQSVQSPEEFYSIYNQSPLLIVDFWAPWCGPCKGISPLFESLSERFPSITFIKVNIDDESMETIVSQFGITSLPTFLFIKNKVLVKQLKGANQQALERSIYELL